MASRLRSYGRTYGWLVGDLGRAFPATVALLTASSAIGVAMRVGAIGIVLAYIHALDKETAVHVAGVDVQATSEPASVALWSAATLIAALAAAGFTYLAEWLAFRTSGRYTHRAAAFVLDVFESGGGPQLPSLPAYQEQDHVRRLLVRDLNMVLRSVLIVFRAVLPAVMLVVSVAALFMIHATLSVLAAFFLLLYAVPFFLLNVRVVRASREREEHSGGVGAGMRRLLPMVMNRRGVSESKRDWAAVYRDMLPIEESLAALEDILLARKRVALLQDIFFGLVLVASLLVYGLLLAGGDEPWALLLGYIIALRFAATSMKQLASYLTSTNRFLPQVQRYVDFVRGSRRRHVSATETERSHWHDDAALTTLTVACEQPTLPGSLKSLTLEPGSPTLVINTMSLHVGTLRRWCRELCGGARSGDALWWRSFYLGDVSRLPAMTLGAIMVHDEMLLERSRAHIETVLDQLGVFEEYRALPNGLATELDAATDQRLSRRMRYAAALMEGVVSGRPTFILQWSALASLPDAFMRAVMDVLHDRLVLVAVDDIAENVPDSCQAVVAVQKRVVGMGDRLWYGSVRPSLLEQWDDALRARAEVLEAHAAGTLLDDDE